MEGIKVALVTGASRGIGKQLALALAEAGYDLAVVARSLEPGAKLPGSLVETVAGVEALGRRALALVVDLSKPEELEGIVEATVAAFGRLDVLINAAAFTSGRSWGAPLAELSYEAWREQYATNLDAPFLLMKAAQPGLRASGGIIVNISSAASEMSGWSESAGAQVSGTGPLASSSSKAALNRLTNALAPQPLAEGIVAVCLEPGFVRTEMVEAMVAKGLDPEGSVPMSLPVAAVLGIISDPDRRRFAGQVVSAVEFDA